jgi:hypothetical protein
MTIQDIKVEENKLGKESTLKRCLLSKKQILFLHKWIFVDKKKTLIIFDGDLDGTSGMAMAINKEEELPKNVYFEFAWGESHGFSYNQIETFYKTHLDNNKHNDLLVITVDNGCSSTSIVSDLKKDYPNSFYFITDHHVSNDFNCSLNTFDFYLNPSDLKVKENNDWVDFYDKNNIRRDSNISGATVFGFLLEELLKFNSLFYDSSSSSYKKDINGPFVDKFLNKKHDISKYNSENLDFKPFACFSQWGDLISYGSDWNYSFSKQLPHISNFPIIKYGLSSSWCRFSSSSLNWAWKSTIPQLTAAFNTTKRLNPIFVKNSSFLNFLNLFNSSNNDFTIVELLDNLPTDKTNEDPLFKNGVLDWFNLWEQKWNDEIEKFHPQIVLNGFNSFKYSFVFFLIQSTTISNEDFNDYVLKISKIKNTLLDFIDFNRDILDNTEFFYCSDPTIRGILSIKTFILREKPILFSLASTSSTSFSGSFRSDNENIYDFLNTYDFKSGSLKLQGHKKAAGASISIFENYSFDDFQSELDKTLSKHFTFEEQTLDTAEDLLISDLLLENSSVKNDIFDLLTNFYWFQDSLYISCTYSDIEKIAYKNKRKIKVGISSNNSTYFNLWLGNTAKISGFGDFILDKDKTKCINLENKPMVFKISFSNFNDKPQLSFEFKQFL